MMITVIITINSKIINLMSIEIMTINLISTKIINSKIIHLMSTEIINTEIMHVFNKLKKVFHSCGVFLSSIVIEGFGTLSFFKNN